MKRWRFALSSRWFGYLVLTIAFAVACALLGLWQWTRNEDRLADIALVEANYDAAPRPVDEVLTETDAFDADQEWLPVELVGEYLVDEQLLVRNRPVAGPGWEVLTPFRLDDGRVFIVDRGWLPVGEEQSLPDDIPAPPEGRATVIARLKPGEPRLDGRTTADGQLASIDLAEVADRVGGDVYTGAYGRLASEDPAPATAPLAWSKPLPDAGPHLSYTFQWFIFGVMGFVGLAWAIRQEYRFRNADDPRERERAAERERRRASKRSDSEEEDALLDRVG